VPTVTGRDPAEERVSAGARYPGKKTWMRKSPGTSAGPCDVMRDEGRIDRSLLPPDVPAGLRRPVPERGTPYKRMLR